MHYSYKDMKSKGLYIDSNLHQRIKELADERGMKIYRLVEIILKEKLEQENHGRKKHDRRRTKNDAGD